MLCKFSSVRNPSWSQCYDKESLKPKRADISAAASAGCVTQQIMHKFPKIKKLKTKKKKKKNHIKKIIKKQQVGSFPSKSTSSQEAYVPPSTSGSAAGSRRLPSPQPWPLGSCPSRGFRGKRGQRQPHGLGERSSTSGEAARRRFTPQKCAMC